MNEANQTQPEVEPVAAAPAAAGGEILQILLAVIPALSPYGPALDLAFTLAETVAPPVYAEVKRLIDWVRSGGTITAVDEATLARLIASLKAPETYFAPPPPDPAKIKAMQVAEVIAQGKTGLAG